MKFHPGNKFGQGRPRGSSYVERCQEWAEHGGWDMLMAWASGREKGKNVPWPLRRYAMSTLIAYGFGRPREALEIVTRRPLQIDFSRISDEELHRIAGMYPDSSTKISQVDPT